MYGHVLRKLHFLVEAHQLSIRCRKPSSYTCITSYFSIFWCVWKVAWWSRNCEYVCWFVCDMVIRVFSRRICCLHRWLLVLLWSWRTSGLPKRRTHSSHCRHPAIHRTMLVSVAWLVWNVNASVAVNFH